MALSNFLFFVLIVQAIQRPRATEGRELLVEIECSFTRICRKDYLNNIVVAVVLEDKLSEWNCVITSE